MARLRGIQQCRSWWCVLKKEIFRGVFGTVGIPYDDSFSKIEEIEIWRISASKGVKVFENTPFKDVRILR